MRRPSLRRDLPRVAIALATALVCSACLTRTIREPVYAERDLDIFLRSQKKSGEPIDRGYDHPVSIAPVRLAHILSRIDVRLEEKKAPERTPAIPTDRLFSVAEGVSKALGEADASQQVVVMITSRKKRLVLFDDSYLTSFVAYVANDQLYVHFSRIDWEVPKNRDETRLPEPYPGKRVMDFRVLPGQAMTPVDPQGLQVAWRDDVFKRPTAVHTLPGGRVVRRTILMESPPEDEASTSGDAAEADAAPPQPAEPDPQDLSPETQRELDELSEERRQGKVSESEYHVRRLEILRNDPASK